MPTGDGNYIAVSDVATDFALVDKITKSGFGTPTSPNAIPDVILEAETYLEGFLMPLGYSRANLIASPLVKRLCLMYSRYAVMRDIYSNIAPSAKEKAVYEKFKDDVDKKLEQITDPESKQKIQLVDSSGALIVRDNPDARYQAATTTPDAERIITMDDPATWGIDSSNSNSSVVGQGGNDENSTEVFPNV